MRKLVIEVKEAGPKHKMIKVLYQTHREHEFVAPVKNLESTVYSDWQVTMPDNIHVKTLASDDSCPGLDMGAFYVRGNKEGSGAEDDETTTVINEVSLEICQLVLLYNEIHNRNSEIIESDYIKEIS